MNYYDEKYNALFFDLLTKYCTRKSDILPKDAMIALINRFVEQIKKEPIEINLEPDGNPLVIVGDIHGAFNSLYRVLLSGSKLDLNSKFVFLGDYVDRGENSIEVLTFLMLLKVAFPTKYYLLRGNHEDSDMNEYHGFKKECLEKYDEEVYNLICKSYDYYSLTCVTADIFCVHGCITKYHEDYNRLIAIEKPVLWHIYSALDMKLYKVVRDLLWSDPLNDDEYNSISEKENDVRGDGHCYGKDSIESFCEMKDVNYIFRAHQYSPEGFRITPDSRVITIFSSSNYCGCFDNEGGFLFLTQDESVYAIHPYDFVEPFSVDNYPLKKTNSSGLP